MCEILFLLKWGKIVTQNIWGKIGFGSVVMVNFIFLVLLHNTKLTNLQMSTRCFIKVYVSKVKNKKEKIWLWDGRNHWHFFLMEMKIAKLSSIKIAIPCMRSSFCLFGIMSELKICSSKSKTSTSYPTD